MTAQRLAAVLALCAAACGPIPPRHDYIHVDLVPLNGQPVAQQQADLDRCSDAAGRQADAVVARTPSVAGQVLLNGIFGALAGAATGAAVGAAFGNAGYGAKVGTASWGTTAAVTGPVTPTPNRHDLAVQWTSECLSRNGYLVQSID
jgi:hypothetical protein